MTVVELRADHAAAKAAVAEPSCPQLIDPRIDFFAFMLLRRCHDAVGVLRGPRALRRALHSCHPPVVLVLATDAAGRPLCRELAKLRHLAESCRSRLPQVALGVTYLPDGASVEVLRAMLRAAAAAYAGFLRLAAAQPKVNIREVPHVPAPVPVDELAASLATLGMADSAARGSVVSCV